MSLIVVYIIGLLMAIIGNVADKNCGKGEMGIPFFVLLWVASPFVVPIVIFIGFLCLVGLLIKWITGLIEKELVK
jgi:hypothetical protein